MKPEEFSQNCPKCGSIDKFLGRTWKFNKSTESIKINTYATATSPGGSLGVISCSECGHVFEYFKGGKWDSLIKKIDIDILLKFLRKKR